MPIALEPFFEFLHLVLGDKFAEPIKARHLSLQERQIGYETLLVLDPWLQFPLYL